MKIPKPIIRQATSQDVEAIVRLANAGGPDGKPRRELPDILPDTYRKAFEIISADPHQQLMVLEIDGVIAGAFHLTFIHYLAGEGCPDAQVEAIHISADYRRQGLGTLMLEWVIQEAKQRSCRRVQLTTDKRRTEAHNLYLRLGFEFSHEGAKLYLGQH